MHRCRNHNKIKFTIKSQQTRATNPTPFPDLPPDTTPGCFDVFFFIEYIILCKYVSFWKSLFKFNASRKGPIIYTPMGKGVGVVVQSQKHLIGPYGVYLKFLQLRLKIMPQRM